VPDFTVATVQRSLQMIYTGCVNMDIQNDLEQVWQFSNKQLQMSMILNWNTAVEKLETIKQLKTVPFKTSVRGLIF
jgi:hypothetical protein